MRRGCPPRVPCSQRGLRGNGQGAAHGVEPAGGAGDLSALEELLTAVRSHGDTGADPNHQQAQTRSVSIDNVVLRVISVLDMGIPSRGAGRRLPDDRLHPRRYVEPVCGGRWCARGWHPVDLSVEIADAAITRAGVTAASVDHVRVGRRAVGAQGANLARDRSPPAGRSPSAVRSSRLALGSGVAALSAAADAIEAGRAAGDRARCRAHRSCSPVLLRSLASTAVPGVMARARFADDGGPSRQPLPPTAMQQHWPSIDRRRTSGDGGRSTAALPHPPAILAVGAWLSDAVAVQRDTPVTTDVIRSIDHELNH